MTAGDAGPAFSLKYSLKADDLRDLYSTDEKLRTRRGWMACVLALCTAAAISLIILGLRGALLPGSPVQPLLFVAIAMLGGVAISSGRVSWRLAPSRLARLSWKKAPALHGRHRDDIGPGGVTVTSPDGTQTFIPWSVVVSIRETSRAFVLRDGDGQVRVVLPKRGLPDPALLPALGTYLREATGTQPPTSSTAGNPTLR